MNLVDPKKGALKFTKDDELMPDVKGLFERLKRVDCISRRKPGGWLTAWLTPLIASRFGWTASFLVAAGLCLTGAAAWLLVDPKRVLETTP